MNRICKSVPYFNKIYQNVSTIDPTQFEKLFQDLKEADCIIISAEGRSRAGLEIGINQIGKEVKTMADPDFPGRNLKEAAPILEKRYRKTALFINSGSGDTTAPKEDAKALKEYIEDTGSERFTIDAITSDPESPIGKISQELGNVLVLKGREKEPSVPAELSEFGIMGDIYELESCLIIQMIKEGINENSDFQEIIKRPAEEMKAIGEMADKYVNSNLYISLVEQMTPRNCVIVGGKGPGENVALKTAIRLYHLKRSIGDSACLAGPFAPRPRPNDLLLLISWSGETPAVLKWCDDFQQAGALVYSVVGKESSLSKKSKSFNLGVSPLRFYLKTAFLLSPLTVKLALSFEKKGYVVPEHILRWVHSITE